MATTTMYDSAYASQIPTDAPIVAGYFDGNYRWSDADWARFSTTKRLRISVLADPGADTFDCEPGNADANSVAQALATRYARGQRSVVYTAEWAAGYRLADVEQQAAARGVPRSAWDWWATDYSGPSTPIPAGAVGLQYADPGPYDLSKMLDTWVASWFGTADPPPPPAPQVIGDTDMQILRQVVTVSLSGSGAGWANVDIDSGKIISLMPEGPWENASSPNPQPAPGAIEAGVTCVSVTGGPPNGHVGVIVTYLG